MRVKERAIKDQGTVEAPELSDRLRDDTMRHDRPSLRSRSGMPRLNLRWAHFASPQSVKSLRPSKCYSSMK